MGSGKKKKNQAFQVSPAVDQVTTEVSLVPCPVCAASGESCVACSGSGQVETAVAEDLVLNVPAITPEHAEESLSAGGDAMSLPMYDEDNLTVIGDILPMSDGTYTWTLNQYQDGSGDLLTDGHVNTFEEAKSAMTASYEAMNCPKCGQFMSVNGGHVCPEGTDAKVAVAERVGNIKDLASSWMQEGMSGEHTAEEVAEFYKSISEETEAALEAMNAEGAGLSPEDWQSLRKELGQANATALGMLTEDELQGLATVNGLPHPALCSPESTAFWLNPAYYKHEGEPLALVRDPKQDKVASAAVSRYQTLLEGGEYNGMNLAAYQEKVNELKEAGYEVSTDALAAAPASLPEGAWAANQQDILNLTVAMGQALGQEDDNWSYWNVGYSTTIDQKVAALDAYEKIAQAYPDPSLSEVERANFENARKHAMNKLESVYSYSKSDELAGAVAKRVGISDEDARYFTPQSMIKTLDPHGGHDVQASMQGYKAWEQAIDGHAAALSPYLKENSYKYYGSNVDFSSLDKDDPEYAAKVSGALIAMREMRKLRNPYNETDMPEGVLRPERGSKAFTDAYEKSPETKNAAWDNVRDWAKEQDMVALRSVAKEMGLENAEHANRSQLTGYMAAHAFEKTKSLDEWQQAVSASIATKAAGAEAKAAQKAAAAQIKAQIKSGEISAEDAAVAQGWAPPPGSKLPAEVFAAAKTAKPKAGKADMTPPTTGSFAETVALAQGFAKHTKASYDALPERLPTEVVEGTTFTSAPNPGLGGMHSKDFFKDPAGNTWMLKPYANAQGGSEARGAAETAASQALQAGGIPAVPVYHATINGKRGAMQPLIKNSGTISADPSTYSQSDVDSVVRMHVGTWLIGDHDMHAGNVLRTAGGGLVPIDQGQAFKNFGRDKLALDYHPNKKYGETPPIWQAMYKQAQGGGLAEGVRVRPEAALGAISQYEAMPDTEWREMLRPVAEQGSKTSSTYWRDPVAKAAAKKLGKDVSSVTNDEIANEFLNQAVERKKNLRVDFMKFFVSEGWTQARQAFTAG